MVRCQPWSTLGCSMRLTSRSSPHRAYSEMTLTERTEFATTSSTLSLSPAPIPLPRVSLPTSTSSPAPPIREPTSPSLLDPFDEPAHLPPTVRLPAPTLTSSTACKLVASPATSSGEEVGKKVKRRHKKTASSRALKKGRSVCAGWTEAQRAAVNSASKDDLPPLAMTIPADPTIFLLPCG